MARLARFPGSGSEAGPIPASRCNAFRGEKFTTFKAPHFCNKDASPKPRLIYAKRFVSSPKTPTCSTTWAPRSGNKAAQPRQRRTT